MAAGRSGRRISGMAAIRQRDERHWRSWRARVVHGGSVYGGDHPSSAEARYRSHIGGKIERTTVLRTWRQALGMDTYRRPMSLNGTLSHIKRNAEMCRQQTTSAAFPFHRNPSATISHHCCCEDFRYKGSGRCNVAV